MKVVAVSSISDDNPGMNRREALTLARVRRQTEDGTARRIREDSGLSQAEVARVCEVTPGAVARWEVGERAPRGRAALRYAKLLDELAAAVA